MKGRKPTPTNIKVLRGNPGKRPLNEEEPVPAPGVPPRPAHLCKEACDEWDRMSAKLLDLGVLTEIDGAALAAYCAAYARWAQAEREIEANGLILRTKTGWAIQNPFLAVANKAMKQMKELTVEFGMTPSSRTRVRAKHSRKESDFDKFMSRRKGVNE